MTASRGTKLVLVVIDGLTPHMLEASLEQRSLPTLTALAERGTLGWAISTFPSLTPVCLSSIATGAHSDVHEIPHLVWWHRGERRLVEYGSSFGAARAAGLGRTLRDTLVGMNAEHLGTRAVTLFEALAAREVPVERFESVAAALDAAGASAGEDDLILVTGSLYTVADARRALGP